MNFRIYNLFRISILIFSISAILFYAKSADASFIVQAPKYIGLSNGLVGYWSFDGGSPGLDRSGNGNHGALTNGPTKTIGKLGQALSFDGVNDYVDIANESAFDFTNKLTISVWFKVRQFDIQWQAIINKGNNSWRLQRNSTSNNLEFAMDNTSCLAIFSNTEPNDGQWHHVVAVYNGSVAYLYIDGVLDTSSSCTGNIFNNSFKVNIGENAQEPGKYFDGLIDDVRIYNRALTAGEIKRLYRIGATLHVNTKINNDSLKNGLVGYWSFDGKDMAGNTAYDRSGQGNNGTLTGGPTRTIGKLGQALSFDGVDDFLSLGNVGTGIKTISFWVKTDNVSNSTIVDIDGTDKIEISTGSISATSFPASTIYIDGVQNSTLTAGWHHILVTDTSGVNASAMNIGKVGSASAISFSELTDGVNLSNNASTASISPTANAQVFLAVAIANGPNTESCVNTISDSLSVSGNNLTWTKIEYKCYASRRAVWVYRGTGASPTTGSITINYTGVGTFQEMMWSVDEATGVDATTPVDTAVTGEASSGTSLALSSLGTAGSGDFSYASFGFEDAADGLISESGFTDLTKRQGGANVRSLIAMYDGTATIDVTPSISWNTDGNGGGGIGFIVNKGGSGGTDFFNGTVDDVRIYNRALSADEIKRLYKIGATPKINTSINNDSLKNGLVGYWSFDGGSPGLDRSGNGNNGTLTNGPKPTIGKLGQALSFDGVDDKVAIDSFTITAASPWTMGGWVKINSHTNQWAMFSFENAGVNLAGIGVRPNVDVGQEGTVADTFSVSVWNGSWFIVNDVSVAPIGVWKYVVATYDLARLRLFVDGQEINSVAFTAGLYNVPGSSKIGEDHRSNGKINGILDDLSIYNRALSADEIKRLYNLGR